MVRLGSSDVEVAFTRPLKDEEKIHPDAKLDHYVRRSELIAALRNVAEKIRTEGVREV